MKRIFTPVGGNNKALSCRTNGWCGGGGDDELQELNYGMICFLILLCASSVTCEVIGHFHVADNKKCTSAVVAREFRLHDQLLLDSS